MALAGWRQWLITDKPSPTARLARLFLRGLSLPYALAMALRNLFYEMGWLTVRRVDLPIICVGNLSVGGTGKTPHVAWLCRWLRDRGFRVAIVSRGYGELDSGVNDEALELEMRLPDVPHLQNRDRAAAAELAHDELDMQVVVLDDGFQHRRLARTVDIVLLDASEPAAGDWLLPGGLMRESWKALRRAHIVVLTRADQASDQRLRQLRQRVQRVAPKALCVQSQVAQRGLHSMASGKHRSVEELRGKDVLAFSGIGNPTSFFASVAGAGLNVVDTRVFPDHHAYSADDVEALRSWAGSHNDCEAVLCTMKDWVKLQLPTLGPLPLLAVEIEVQWIDPREKELLEEKLSEYLSTATQ